MVRGYLLGVAVWWAELIRHDERDDIRFVSARYLASLDKREPLSVKERFACFQDELGFVSPVDVAGPEDELVELASLGHNALNHDWNPWFAFHIGILLWSRIYITLKGINSKSLGPDFRKRIQLSLLDKASNSSMSCLSGVTSLA